MTITVNTPDGGTAAFPDGTDKDTITAAMKDKFGGPAEIDDSNMGQVGNFLYRAANTGTLGLADLGLAGVHAAERASGYDPNAADLATIRKQDEAYAQAHPYQALAADLAGYGIGFGKLGIAVRGAKALEGLGMGARLAQAGGTAGEAIAADVGSHATRGELPSTGDIATDLTVGGSLGALIGGRGRALAPALERAGGKVGTEGIGAAGRDFLGPETPPPAARSVDDLIADKNAKYGILENTSIKPTTVGNAIEKATNALTPGQQAGMSGGLRSQIDQVNSIIDNSPKLSLGDVDSFQRSIGAASRTNADSIASAKIGEALRQLGGQPMADAQMAQARLGDAQWLSAKSPTEAALAAQGRLDNPRLNFDPAGRDAMQALAESAPNNKWANMLQGVLGNKATTATVGAISGGLGGGFLGSTGGAVAAPIVSEVINQGLSAARGRAARRAYKAALAATSTGLPVSPDAYQMAPWLSQAARRGYLSQEENRQD